MSQHNAATTITTTPVTESRRELLDGLSRDPSWHTEAYSRLTLTSYLQMHNGSWHKQTKNHILIYPAILDYFRIQFGQHSLLAHLRKVRPMTMSPLADKTGSVPVLAGSLAFLRPSPNSPPQRKHTQSEPEAAAPRPVCTTRPWGQALVLSYSHIKESDATLTLHCLTSTFLFSIQSISAIIRFVIASSQSVIYL